MGLQWGGKAEHTIGKPTSLSRNQPIDRLVDVVAEVNTQNLVGRGVQLTAPLQEVWSDTIFWVGNLEYGRVAVVFGNPDDAPALSLQAPAAIEVFGTVRDSAELGAIAHITALDNRRQQQLESSKVFIEARRLKLASTSGAGDSEP